MFANVLNFRNRNTQVADAGPASAIEHRFPRIAQELAEHWLRGDIDPYLNSLLLDDRGNRQGFPADVLDELMFLSSLRWQLQHPAFSRADEGLAEGFRFSCGGEPVLDSRLCVSNRGWILG